jgi:hypothetical protein
MDIASAVSEVERCAASNGEPQWIADLIAGSIRQGGRWSLFAALEKRIAELSEAAKSRPNHKKLARGIETMREVAKLLAPGVAKTELDELADRIRVCVQKADNYAATAGEHLRQARDRCREIGLDFNKWCAQADLGIKRSRIYQLMGPDPIAAAEITLRKREMSSRWTLHSLRMWKSLV